MNIKNCILKWLVIQKFLFRISTGIKFCRIKKVSSDKEIKIIIFVVIVGNNSDYYCEADFQVDLMIEKYFEFWAFYFQLSSN